MKRWAIAETKIETGIRYEHHLKAA